MESGLRVSNFTHSRVWKSIVKSTFIGMGAIVVTNEGVLTLMKI